MNSPDTLNASFISEFTHWRAYLALCKIKVVALIVFTAFVGMLLAVPGVPPLDLVLFATLGIGMAASSAAAINHILDREFDQHMGRTADRPLPTGQVGIKQATVFALGLGALSMLVLALLVNPLTAILTLATLVGYAIIYTRYLKHMTPQNIVIGGAAGAAPPVLGWAAMTNQVTAEPLLLFLIVFIWTPPHFWALAIHRRAEYAKADIPMLPVTHGVEFTRLHILLYTILLVLVTLLPYLIHMTGAIYLAATLLLNVGFMYYATMLYLQKSDELPIKTFVFSLYYLMGIFSALLVDHYAQLL